MAGVTSWGKPAAPLGRLVGVRTLRAAPREVPEVAEVDEERLVRLVAKGDRSAFEELYRRTSPWLAVWRAAGAFAGAAVGGTAVGWLAGWLAGWLWTIAARRLVDAFRRRAHHAEPPPAAAVPEQAPAAEELALAGTVGGEVGDALRCLAPELRQVPSATARA